jgi:hypothetical protein
MLLLAYSQPVGLPYLLVQDVLDAGDHLVRAITSTDWRECGAQSPWLVKRSRASVRARVSRISQASCAVSAGVASPANTPTV